MEWCWFFAASQLSVLVAICDLDALHVIGMQPIDSSCGVDHGNLDCPIATSRRGLLLDTVMFFFFIGPALYWHGANLCGILGHRAVFILHRILLFHRHEANSFVKPPACSRGCLLFLHSNRRFVCVFSSVSKTVD